MEMSHLRPHPTAEPPQTSGQSHRSQRRRQKQQQRQSLVKQRATTNSHLHLLHRLPLPRVRLSGGALQIFDQFLLYLTGRASQVLMHRYEGWSLRNQPCRMIKYQVFLSILFLKKQSEFSYLTFATLFPFFFFFLDIITPWGTRKPTISQVIFSMSVSECL